MRGATTIEQTGKKWKTVQVVGWIFAGLAILLLFVGMILRDRDNETAAGIVLGSGCLLFTVGALVDFVGRVGAWWYHG